MKNRVMAMVLGLAIAACMSACGTGNNSNSAASVTTASTEASTEAVTAEETDGGWEINQNSLSMEDNKEAKAAFEKAVEGLTGYTYEPVAFLGSQVVSGTNYAFLCKGTPVVPDAQSEYIIVTVYEDLEGNAQITDTQDLLETGDEGSTGSWSYNQGETSLDADANADVKAALDKALDGLTGADYDPIAYIGSQVVSGNNYAIFCSVTPVVPDGQRSFALVTVYADLDGNADLTEVKDIELGGSSDTAESSQETSEIPNPFVEVSDLSEAEQLTGFDLTVPEAPADYPDMTVEVMNNSMIQVIFENKANETEDGIDEGYRIRKEAGSDDISGDYNDYADVHTEEIGGNTVTVKGDGNTISVATWTADGYTYAVDAEDHPMSLEEMTAVIEATK